MVHRLISRALFVLCMVATAARAQPDSSTTKTSEGPWHKIKSADGHTKSKPVIVKFQPGTTKWRLTFSSTADKDTVGRNNPSANIRIALMVETMRDVEGKPVNWSQVDVLFNGKPGEPQTRVFDNGLGKDGKERWFQLVITGYVSEYEVTIEDQSADDSAKSKTKSKQKKKSDD